MHKLATVNQFYTSGSETAHILALGKSYKNSLLELSSSDTLLSIESSVNKPNTFNTSHYLAPRYWPTWLGLSLIWLLSRLPFESQLKFGEKLGKLLYYAVPARRKICITNLKIAFPNKSNDEISSICKSVYKNIGYTIAEMATVWFRPLSFYAHRFELIGKEHLNDAINSDTGTILLQAHFNTLEFCGAWLGPQIPGIGAVYDNPKNPLYAALLKNQREKFVSDAIDNRDIRHMVKLLKSGGIVWYSPDQAVSKKRGGIETEFFNHPVLTTPGTSRMARMSGARIMPYLPVRDTRLGYYKLYIYPAIDALLGDDITAETNTLNQLFEEHIKQYPEQYFWVHKRFKRPSKEHTDPYK